MSLALVRSPADGAVDPVVDPDLDLVARARRGDQAAFAALFRAHHGRVHAMCARLLGGSGRGSHDGDIDDAVQQTFLEAWRCLHRFEGKSRFTTWLTRIAIHTSFSVRRRLRRLLLDDDDRHALTVLHGDGAADPAPAPDEAASQRARARALNEALLQLAPKKRVVFVLADLDELTSPEIAAILEIPEATVRTRLFYARKELAALLRRHPGFADLVARLRDPQDGADGTGGADGDGGASPGGRA